MMLTRTEIHHEIEQVLIPLAANGNEHAANYLHRFFFIVRKLDDVWDQDEPVTAQDISKSYFLALVDLPLNPFYMAHQATLTGVQLIAFNAWLDANEMAETGDSLKELYSHVIRDYVIELFPLVAYLTGGFEHMREVSKKARAAFEKPLGE